MTDQTDILPHYFAGECDANERALVEAWAREHPAEFGRAREAWNAAGGMVVPSQDVARAFAGNLSRSVRADVGATLSVAHHGIGTSSDQGRHRVSPLQRYVAIAAILLIAVFGIKYIPNTTQSTPTTKIYTLTS